MPNFTPVNPLGFRNPLAFTSAAVTVTNRGQLLLSHLAWEQIGRPDRVELLIDPDAKLLGFRPITRGGYSVTKTGTNLSVSGRTALRQLSRTHEASRRYPLQIIDGTHCIDLSLPGQAITVRDRTQSQA